MLVTFPRIALVAAIFAGPACAQTPASSGVVVAPVVPASSAPADGGELAPLLTAGQGATDAAASEAGAPAEFRACATDTDCVAVPRVGCCHNGWMEAVAASQQGAYAASFVCPIAHPICPMILIRDTRIPRCNATTHLCELVAGH
jgi:hypothetical protein